MSQMDYTDVFPVNISRALKEKLTGIMVKTTNVPSLEVPVHFINPQFEFTKASYPGIYIAYGPITKADDREHRGQALLPYAPVDMPVDVQVPADMEDKDSADTVSWEDAGRPLDSSPYWVPDVPVPYNVDFNIAVLTRDYQQMMQIVWQMQDIERFPARFGGLEIPEDGTVRTLELLGGPDTTATTDEDGKRLVQTLYSVRVAAELSLYDVQQVNRVVGIDVEIGTL